jgi:hypothetical protein
MTEKSLELGPIVATSMIAVGLAIIVWAVATNPRPAGGLGAPSFRVTTGTTALGGAEPEPEHEGGLSDSEWEETLIDVERIRTDGLVTNVDAEAQVATVSTEKWAALSEERQREIGRHLAIYCGRVSNTDRYQVEIRDQSGEKVGEYERD